MQDIVGSRLPYYLIVVVLLTFNWRNLNTFYCFFHGKSLPNLSIGIPQMVSLLQKTMSTNPSLVEQTLEERPNHIGAALVTISEAMMESFV